jgi:hypothetical protein
MCQVFITREDTAAISGVDVQEKKQPFRQSVLLNTNQLGRTHLAGF